VITRRGGLVRGGVGDEFRPVAAGTAEIRHGVGRFRGERGDTLQLPFPYVVDVEYHQLVIAGDVRVEAFPGVGGLWGESGQFFL